MKKLILGCLLALFASGCNDNEPEQKPVELKISFAGENPVEFTVGEQKRLAFTVTGDDLEGLTFAAEPDEALSGWTVVVSAGREGDAYAGALDVLSVSKTTSDAGLRALCCVCVGVCLFIFAVRRNGTVFNQKRIKDEKTDLRMFAGPVCIGL